MDKNSLQLITNKKNYFERKKMELKNIDTNLDNDERYLFTNISTSNKMEEELEETNINISSDNKLKKEKILSIEIITSTYIAKGTIIKLTKNGYKDGLRQANDGITFFGYQEPDKINTNVNI
jgi:hypothetical protein